MSNARNLADLLDSTGDVKSDALDNAQAPLTAGTDYLTPTGDGSALTGVGVDGISSSATGTAITINSSDRVGIGETTPEAKLEVEAGTEVGLFVRATVNNEYGAVFQSASTNSTPIADFRKSGGTSQLQVLSDGRGLSQFTAKAWVMANATGTPSIYDSHNISSLTDYETGQLGCNFANNMSNTNYAVIANGWGGYTWTFGYFDRYASVFRLVGSNGSAYADAQEVSAVVFGD